MLTLYHYPTSPCAAKVRCVLAEKGLDWESRVVDIIEKDNLKPEYLRLHPKGLVPTLVDGDKVATRMTAHVRSRESGEAMTMIGINLAVIRDGQVVEEWNTWEMVQSAQSLSMQGA